MLFRFCQSRSGKQRKRKRKDEDIESESQEEKDLQIIAIDNVTDVVISTLDDRLSAAPFNKKLHRDLPISQEPLDSIHEGELDGKFDGSRKKDEYDLKLIDFNASISGNMVDSEKKTVASNDVSLVYDVSKADCVVGSAQVSHSTGAKRRKSSRVKRFTKDSALPEQGLKQNAATVSIEPIDPSEQLGPQNPSSSGHSRNVSTITRIIRPVGYSVSVLNNIPDVIVTFLAVRFVMQHYLLFLC